MIYRHNYLKTTGMPEDNTGDPKSMSVCTTTTITFQDYSLQKLLLLILQLLFKGYLFYVTRLLQWTGQPEFGSHSDARWKLYSTS